jgi:hypothetical protein
MSTTDNQQPQFSVDKRTLLALINTFAGQGRFRPADDDPRPPGPLGPIIRIALERTAALEGRLQAGNSAEWKAFLVSLFARRPEIFDAIGGGLRFGDEVALNPQPLPPRWAFLASFVRTIAERAELIHEVASAVAVDGEEQAIIIVGGYVRRLCDDFLRSDFKLWWPYPDPHPNWFAKELNSTDFVWMATQFEQAANQGVHPALGRVLADASSNLIEVGLSRLA